MDVVQDKAHKLRKSLNSTKKNKAITNTKTKNPPLRKRSKSDGNIKSDYIDELRSKLATHQDLSTTEISQSPPVVRIIDDGIETLISPVLSTSHSDNNIHDTHQEGFVSTWTVRPSQQSGKSILGRSSRIRNEDLGLGGNRLVQLPQLPIQPQMNVSTSPQGPLSPSKGKSFSGMRLSKRDEPKKVSPPVPEEPLPWESELFTKVWSGIPKTEREKTVAELFTTEQAYVKDLNIIKHIWEQPLQREKLPFKIKSQSISTLFGNLNQILGINTKFLEELSIFVDSWDDHKEIGDMLARMMPFFQSYGDYVSGYDDAIYTFEKLMKQLPVQKWFLNIQANEPLCKNLNFDAFLIKPVQRVPRYKLFIDRLVKCTPKDHGDYPKLLLALGTCDNIAHIINQAKEKQIQREKMSEIAAMIDCGNELLMIPGRTFIKNVFDLEKITRKALKKARHLFLFSDVLMVSLPPLPGQKHVIRGQMLLKGSQVKELPDDIENDLTNRFVFLSYPKSLELTAPDKEIKKEWIDILTTAIQEADKSLASGIKGVVVTYQRDGEVKSCPICEEKFTAIFRRHHCRQCRRVVCGNCTKHKKKLPSTQHVERKKRVCDECLNKPADWRPDNVQSIPGGKEEELDVDSSSEEGVARPLLPEDLPEIIL